MRERLREGEIHRKGRNMDGVRKDKGEEKKTWMNSTVEKRGRRKDRRKKKKNIQGGKAEEREKQKEKKRKEGYKKIKEEERKE